MKNPLLLQNSVFFVSDIFFFSLTGQESDFLAVLYDYPSADISQPIFHVGEKLRVLSE